MKSHRIILCMLAALVLAACGSPPPEQQGKRVEDAQLEQMFARIRTTTKWNIDGPMLWGYFFFDPDRKKLEQVANALRGSGYQVVGIEPTESKTFMLHVERIEIHTPTSLHARNVEFHAIATKYSVASYDGMDVGPPPEATQ
jgi:hypothetical protein